MMTYLMKNPNNRAEFSKMSIIGAGIMVITVKLRIYLAQRSSMSSKPSEYFTMVAMASSLPRPLLKQHWAFGKSEVPFLNQLHICTTAKHVHTVAVTTWL